jgi:hypothetical protein
MKRFFPIVDADKDGFLTKEELTAAAKLMEHRGGNRGGQRDQLPTEKPQL